VTLFVLLGYTCVVSVFTIYYWSGTSRSLMLAKKLTVISVVDLLVLRAGNGYCRQCKSWDPIGTATLCTLIDTNFYKPDDGQIRPKHVADVISCRITTVNCVV